MLFVVCWCVLLVVWCSLIVVCWLFVDVRRSLFVDCVSSIVVVRVVLCVVWCVMCVACCVLRVVVSCV